MHFFWEEKERKKRHPCSPQMIPPQKKRKEKKRESGSMFVAFLSRDMKLWMVERKQQTKSSELKEHCQSAKYSLYGLRLHRSDRHSGTAELQKEEKLP